MKILDQYIIKQFLKSFFFMFLLFIPIGILVDVSEKIDKFKEHDLGFYEVFNYYLDFIWYYGYFLFPIFVFLAVIWFTSKLSTNSEVVAILSSGVSFRRYLHPFILTSIFIAILSLFLFLLTLNFSDLFAKSSYSRLSIGAGLNNFQENGYAICPNPGDAGCDSSSGSTTPTGPYMQSSTAFNLEYLDANSLF